MSPLADRSPTGGAATCQIDEDGVVSRCTAGFALRLGMPYHAVIGRRLGALLDAALGVSGFEGRHTFGASGVLDDPAAGVRVVFEPLVAANGEPEGALCTLEALPDAPELALALQRLFDAQLVGAVVWTRQGRIVDANDAWLRMVGLSREALATLDWSAVVPPDEEDTLRGLVAEAQAAGSAGPGRFTLLRTDGRRVPVLFAMIALPEPDRFVTCVVDAAPFVRVEDERARLLEREQVARMEVEEAQRSLGFLYQTTSALFEEARDPRQLLERLAELSVPHLADWCLIDIFVGEAVECVAAAHWDPEHAATAAGLCRRWEPDPGARVGVARAAREGRTQLGSAADLAAAEAETEDWRQLLRLRAHSWMQVPIRLHGQTTAVVTLAFAESTRVHGPEDVALAEDLAARAAIALDNARLFAEVERAVRAREEALHIVSHDLKNPIAVLLLKAQRLRRVMPAGDEGARARTLVEQLERTIMGMNRLIEGLLDLARMEAGRLKLDRRVEAPSAVVTRAVEPLQSLAHDRGQRLEIAVSESLPPIDADPDRLAQVLANLVGNALKYTPEGGRIRVEAQASPSEVCFTVADTGPGIPAEQLPHLFERFWQARAAGRTGHGLGLSIVQGLVEAHDGRVWVDSQPGQGSRFHFSIPRASTDADGR